jgi:hypothetical protein
VKSVEVPEELQVHSHLLKMYVQVGSWNCLLLLFGFALQRMWCWSSLFSC